VGEKEHESKLPKTNRNDGSNAPKRLMDLNPGMNNNPTQESEPLRNACT
jgi:hypothetical protein